MDKREFDDKLEAVVGILERNGVKVAGRHVVGNHEGVVLALDIGGVVTDRRLDEIGRILHAPQINYLWNIDPEKPRPFRARTLPDQALRITDDEIHGLLGDHDPDLDFSDDPDLLGAD